MEINGREIAKKMGHNKRKRTFWYLRKTKTQISLHIRAVWSESSLSAWRNIASLAIQNEHSEDSEKIARMRRLIWIFAGCACSKVCFLSLRLKWKQIATINR